MPYDAEGWYSKRDRRNRRPRDYIGWLIIGVLVAFFLLVLLMFSMGAFLRG